MKDTAVLQRSALRASWLADYVELTKPRITLLVALTAAVGYFMGSREGLWAWGLFHTAIGTAMVAAGAGVLNQVTERDADARMLRTMRRAIPAGRVSPESGLRFGLLLGVGGVLYVAGTLNLLTAALAATTLASYVFVYTPLKRKTSLNTLIGAIPGALPPVGGWAAATGSISREAWVLFLIVFLWQIPHFLAIAWMLREDYARGGFKMLPVGDVGGRITGRHMALSALALVPVSLAPTLLGMSGPVYFAGAFLLSGAYAALAVRTAFALSSGSAKGLFLASIIYLPALLATLMIDRLPG